MKARLIEYQRQFEESSMSYIIFDKNFQILYANQMAKEISYKLFNRNMNTHGYMLDFVTEGFLDNFKIAVQATLDGDVKVFEKSVQSKSGQAYWFHYEFTPFYVNDIIEGTILRSFETSENFRNHHSLTNYKDLFTSIDEQITLLDHSGGVIWCNRKLCKYDDQLCFKDCMITDFKNHSDINVDLSSALQHVDAFDEWKGVFTLPSIHDSGMRIIDKKIVEFSNNSFENSRYIVVSKDITEQETYKNKSESRFKFDNVTGIFNRNVMELMIHQKILEKNAFHLINLDIDAFGRINQLKGYKFGDMLLNEMVSFILRHLPEATIFRSHSDSFFIMVENDANIKMMRETFKEKYMDFKGVKYAFSIGISLFPKDGKETFSLIMSAETAMRRAKARNGITLEYYHDELNRQTELAAHINSKLIDATQYGTFLSLNYQPVFDCNHNEIVGCEALIRWKDHDYGAIPPNVFIPVAEENGSINSITRFVLDQVINLLNANKSMFKDKFVSINISILDLMGDELFDYIKDIVSINPWIVHQIKFEITETSIVQDLKMFNEGVSGLRDLGFAIAVDDFGTGFSSIDKLVSVEFDVLKIDKKFVDLILESKTDHIVLQTIVALANRLSLDIVAEGIEEIEQVLALKDLGITKMQGYYFYKPMTKEDILKFI